MRESTHVGWVGEKERRKKTSCLTRRVLQITESGNTGIRRTINVEIEWLEKSINLPLDSISCGELHQLKVMMFHQ